MKSKILFILLFAMAASVISAKTTTISVNEFEYSRISRSTMMTTATNISNAIDMVQPRWRVMSPEFVVANIRGANLAQGGSYRERSLGIGRHLSADFVLIGAIGHDEQGYTIGIRLIEVNSGRVLLEYENRHKDLDALNGTSSDIAARVVNAVNKTVQKEKPKKQRDLEYATGVSLGQESVTRTAVVPGGSHLFLALSGNLNDTLAIEARYSVGMFPIAFSANIASATLLLNIPYSKDAGLLLGAGYSAATANFSDWSHMMRFSVSPIYSGETDDFVFSLLPMSLSFDMHTKEYLFTFQLLSMSVLF